jgi:hypothetical protein
LILREPPLEVSVVLLDVICAAAVSCTADGLDRTVRLSLAENSLWGSRCGKTFVIVHFGINILQFM